MYNCGEKLMQLYSEIKVNYWEHSTFLVKLR